MAIECRGGKDNTRVGQAVSGSLFFLFVCGGNGERERERVRARQWEGEKSNRDEERNDGGGFRQRTQ